jgi:hypothetical protein
MPTHKQEEEEIYIHTNDVDPLWGGATSSR